MYESISMIHLKMILPYMENGKTPTFLQETK